MLMCDWREYKNSYDKCLILKGCGRLVFNIYPINISLTIFVYGACQDDGEENINF